jgi:tetratricopeptide (TPR) repeat protein
LRRSYGSVDEFLSAGVAEISIDLLRDFGVDRAPAGPFTGPQADLPLSGDWEAIRHFYLGHEAMTRLDRTIAERELTSALEIDPEFALARIELADLRVNQLRWEDAKVQALEATRFAPNLERVDRLRLEAILARIDQNITLERSILRKMIGLQPQKKEFLFALAESFFHTADADLASIRFQQVLELDPDFALAHNHLGYCYSWKGEHDAAIASLERYLQLDGTANAYDSLGHGLMAAGKYDEARAAFQRSIDLDSSLEFTKYGLAFVEILQGRFQTAQNLLGQFIAESRSPQESGLYLYALGYLYLQLQDPEQALKACNQGLAGFPEETVDPTYQDLVWLKGLVLLEKDDRTGAQAQLAKLQRAVNRDGVTATKYQPVLKYSLHLEAMIAATAGQLAACSEAIGRLLHLEEKMGYWGAPLDRSYFLDSAGCLYERLRLKRDAEALYRSALSYNGNYAISRFHLGKLLMEQNREREAAPYLRSFLDSWGEADRDMREVQEAGTLLGLASRGAD